MKAIFKREFRSYFTTPIGYVFLALYLAANGILFSLSTILQGSSSNVQAYFILSTIALIIVIPILTMKVFSEEKKAKTEQLLLTAPVSLFSIVLGKFFASFLVYSIGVLISCFGFIVLFAYGSTSFAILVSSVFVELLIGGACIAIGIFISSTTENQFIACIVSMAVLILLVAMSFVENSVTSTFLKTVMTWICVLDRAVKFFAGRFDIPAMIYYISLIFIFVFLTVRNLERRRWN